MAEEHENESSGNFPTARELYQVELPSYGSEGDERVNQDKAMDEIVRELALSFFKFGFDVARHLCGRSADDLLGEFDLLVEIASGKQTLVDSTAEQRRLKPEFWKPLLNESSTQRRIEQHRRIARLVLETQNGKDIVEEWLKEALADDPPNPED